MNEVPEENLLASEPSVPEAPPEPHPPNESAFRHFLAEWTTTVLLLLFGTTTLIQAYVIPTSSMEDNLLIGDHLLVDKLAYSPPGPVSQYLLPYTPIQRGDIIVFRYPVDIRQNFVKRVIAVSGDRLRLNDRQVILNGKPIPEPYKIHKIDWRDNYRDNFPTYPNSLVDRLAQEMLDRNVKSGEVIVPPDHYFVMGDNRDSSLDSRYWGFVPRRNIIGKPLLIYWSYDTTTDRLVNTGLDLAHVKDLARNLFKKTRWNRTFMLIRGAPIPN